MVRFRDLSTSYFSFSRSACGGARSQSVKSVDSNTSGGLRLTARARASRSEGEEKRTVARRGYVNEERRGARMAGGHGVGDGRDTATDTRNRAKRRSAFAPLPLDVFRHLLRTRRAVE